MNQKIKTITSIIPMMRRTEIAPRVLPITVNAESFGTETEVVSGSVVGSESEATVIIVILSHLFQVL